MSMKFLIVSDTHGRMYNLEEAMEREEFDGMIHCGDVEGMDDLIKSRDFHAFLRPAGAYGRTVRYPHPWKAPPHRFPPGRAIRRSYDRV